MWQTPKTDWHGEIIDGSYVGDRFNAEDFNRIKNNLIYLRDLAVKMYDEFEIQFVCDNKSVADFFYADEINLMEQNFNTINANTFNEPYGESPEYVDNGNTMDFTELNRLEGAMLDLYIKLYNESEGRRMFTWNFGTEGGMF